MYKLGGRPLSLLRQHGTDGKRTPRACLREGIVFENKSRL